MEPTSKTLGGGAAASGTATPGSSKVRVRVYETNKEMNTQTYSGNDMEALEAVILPLWRTIDGEEGCAEMEWDDEGVYVVFRDWEGQERPFPEELLTKQVGFKWDRRALIGETISIHPPQYGSNTWPSDMKVKFTPVPSAGNTPNTTSAE